MKKITYILLLVFGITLITSCVEEDYFGASSSGNIKEILVSNQAGNAVILTDSLLVKVEIPGGVDLTQITLETLEISSFAYANKSVGDVLNLQDNQMIMVTAEDGSVHPWTIEAIVASETPQLSNGDLNQWYLTSSNYYEPGSDANTTIWGTGNQGTQILGDLATFPEDLGSGNLAAKLITLDLGPLAGTFGTPIAAGSLFTGYFNPDNIEISDPEAAIEFGTPFAARPTKLRFKYQYTPGPENEDQDGNPLNYGDACDIYALLEIRQSGNIQRLATAWFRSDAEQGSLTTQEVDFIYGELDASYPAYMFPENGIFVSDDLAQFGLSTHITFVASSSFDGAHFAGAVDSELIIDDIELVYE
ncbi:PCMD domain-containing protein [Mangrovimonas sp. AS39]|uniref:PCMD domain-containing protein n=1 Tax=Mangrovimonas futianensis TaxID=2895523 RepID=UPI001E64C527|nr:PCMD domain-containing protein [Mangrovimonas futianensis]MCF1191330.1 PCMD domain-containing protein [Mangrovimonas futianensis]MCF1195025.1 PCMD domain-containing protein [Mangrovimonas futianensis]